MISSIQIRNLHSPHTSGIRKLHRLAAAFACLLVIAGQTRGQAECGCATESRLERSQPLSTGDPACSINARNRLKPAVNIARTACRYHGARGSTGSCTDCAQRFGVPKPAANRAAKTPATMVHMRSSDSLQLDWEQTVSFPPGPGYDRSVDVVVDSLQNAYVTGYSTHLPDGGGMVTIRYDAQGREVWNRRWRGEPGESIRPVGIGLLPAGGVVVAGTRDSGSSASSIVILGYTGDGEVVWTSEFAAPSGRSVSAAAMETNNAGTTVIAAQEGSLHHDRDWLMLSYAANGALRWTDSFAGAVGMADLAAAVTLNENGEAAITGMSTEEEDTDACVTILYEPDGTRRWVVHRRGMPGSHMEGRAVRFGSDGDVLVSGDQRAHSNANSTMFTVKYASNGGEMWQRDFVGEDDDISWPADVQVDGAGNVFVAANDGDAYFTIKYRPDGSTDWFDWYRGDFDWLGSDARKLAIGADGSVYVAGISDDQMTTLRYTADGRRIWRQRTTASADGTDDLGGLAVDQEGNAYVTGSVEVSSGFFGDSDFRTVRYSRVGRSTWTRDYSGPGRAQTTGELITVSPNGDLRIAGTTERAELDRDMFIANVAADGRVVWQTAVEQPGIDLPKAIAADRTGDIYLTGWNQPERGPWRAVTSKIDANGSEVWRQIAHGEISLEPYSIAVDNLKNAYVGSFWRFVLLSYDENGTERWRKFDEETSPDVLLELQTGPDGAVYALGKRYGDPVIESVHLRKYSSEGVEEWRTSFGFPGRLRTRPGGFIVDAAGRVFVVAQTQSLAGWQIVTVALSPSGEQEWIELYSGAEGWTGGLHARGIQQDAAGDLIVSGTSLTTLNRRVPLILKYAPDGRQKFAWRYDPGDSPVVSFRRALTDRVNNLYLTMSNGDGGGSLMSFLSLDQFGEERWTVDVPGPAFRTAAIDNDGNLFSMSNTAGLGWRGFSVRKFRQNASLTRVPERLTAAPNFPNPFNAQTRIRFGIPASSRVSLKIYSTLGREVATLFDGSLEAGWHERFWDASRVATGVYIYRLQTEGASATRKLLLVK